jgi:hypothetical protein
MVFALSDSFSAISVTVFSRGDMGHDSYSRSESVSCGVRVEILCYSQGQFFSQRGTYISPPARILRMAFANSSGALSFVM